MTKKKLFDEDSEEEEVSLKTENEYAKKYDRWREKEELHKLEQKYGSKSLDSNGSESDSEDESDEPPEINEEVEVQFLKTLSLLKTKDPRIYDPNYKFFDEKVEKEKEKKEEVKKVTFADSDDDDDDGPNIFSIEKKAEIDEPVKKDTKPEDGKLKDFLTGKAEHIDDEVEKDLAPLKSLWSDPTLNDGEAFLRDYILNKRYLDDDDEAVPEEKVRDDEDLEADEKTVEEQGKFERAYNFRFEEPDEEYLKRYPRTMNYIRPKDDRRSRKRAEIRERKEQEKKKKMEEIARMKALKLKEIQEKIAKIKEVTGNEDLAFEEQDIEGDFDPDEHDKRMKQLFDEQFYGQADDEKPVFPDLDEELEIENWDNYENEKQNDNEDGPHCEDEDFNMDADYDPKKAKENLVEELKRSVGKKRRNRKRKSKLAEILAEDKPKFVPDVEKTYSEFMEEYYKMDCEDVIGGDLPTRFKYREVVPNDYGLSIEEILLADDKELTQWVPLKKIVKYRPENIEKSEVNTYRQKAADERLKRKVLPSLFKDLPEEPEVVVPLEETIKKKKKKKKKNKTKNDDETEVSNNKDEENTELNDLSENNDTGIENEVKTKKNKKKKHKHESQNAAEINTEDNSINVVDENTSNINDNKDNDSAIEANEGKKKKKHKTEVTNCVQVNNEKEVVENSQINENSRRKKKKKNKQINADIQTNGESTQANTDKSINIIATNFGKRKKHNSFTVEDVNSESTKASKTGVFNKTQGQKRKANFNDDNAPKRKKNKKQFNNDKKKTSNNKSSDNKNPLSKLSDERLKAYGLNPKKYRSFLKYKKF